MGKTKAKEDLLIVDELRVDTLKVDGVEVTATAAELNALDGITASVAELNIMDGVTASTAELNIMDGVTASTAELNIMDGVTKNASQINLLVAGVAAGYKIARGVTAIGAASEDIATGLATVVAAVVSLVGDPSMTHMFSTVTVGDQAGAPAAGSIRVKSWKPTAANDVTPIAADTVFANVAWIAVGT